MAVRMLQQIASTAWVDWFGVYWIFYLASVSPFSAPLANTEERKTNGMFHDNVIAQYVAFLPICAIQYLALPCFGLHFLLSFYTRFIVCLKLLLFLFRFFVCCIWFVSLWMSTFQFLFCPLLCVLLCSRFPGSVIFHSFHVLCCVHVIVFSRKKFF